MDYANMTEEELMTRYYAGDDRAFRELNDRYWERLVSSAERRLPRTSPGRLQVAEDLANEALSRAARTRRNPAAMWREELGNVRPWLTTILHRLIYDFRQPREAASTDLPQTSQEAESQRIEETIAAEDIESLARVLQEELWDVLGDCVDHLSEEERDIVAMHVWEEQSFPEIAAARGMAVATVWRRWRSALAQLAECLRRRNVTE